MDIDSPTQGILNIIDDADTPLNYDVIERQVIGECYECRDDIYEDEDYVQFTESGDSDINKHKLCESCRVHGYYSQCSECDTWTDCTDAVRGYIGSFCSPCIEVIGVFYCDGCSEYVSDDEYRADSLCNGCWSCECYECDCTDCYPDGCDCDSCTDSDDLHSYSYKPDPIFFNGVGDYQYRPDEQTTYLGMELEIGIDRISSAVDVLTFQAGNFIYCKEDSSVDGLEMVTHPMILSASRELIPFEALRTLRNEMGASAWKYGIHVHVARTSFDSDIHAYRWMKLLYRNQSDVKRIARRDSGEWASFNNESRINQKYTAETRKGKRSYKHSVYTRRYSAINVENSATFEVRVFRGSLRKDEILAALELVAGSVEYTRQLSTTDIIHNGGWEWSRFIKWASFQGDTYENLINLDAKTSGRVAQLVGA
jgi:hypothetical protein